MDTPDGREIKQGVVGVFAARSFNPRESVRLKDDSSISLTQYAARRNLQLVKAADFNEKMRERGVDRLTVQIICRVARDEAQLRETLDSLWKTLESAGEIMRELRAENEDLYRFEKMLEKGDSEIKTN